MACWQVRIDIFLPHFWAFAPIFLNTASKNFRNLSEGSSLSGCLSSAFQFYRK
jgi:hypothetical protein